MSQINVASIEPQHKIIQFLRNEFNKLKSDYHQKFNKGIYQRKKIDKKLQKLSIKLDTMLKINPMDQKILEDLLNLQQEIKNILNNN